MLLPYNDPIVKLIIQMIHEKNKHCGPQALLAYVRQRYWPIKGKSAARAIVQNCVRCTRARPKLLNQIMGQLPTTRVTPARPFINAGVDFCGPFWVHFKIRGKRAQKAYIAVFCCFATKAVHLELVSDLTTEAFLGAMRRFISRRGHCKNLYCDNATNFIGAKNQLSELADAVYAAPAHDKISQECTSRGINFHFIPPRAPHFGGLWEAAVKSAKHLLVRSVATASLTYEELDTVVIEIEGILNSRPISPMSNNPNDLAALTPGHFLIGEPLNSQLDSDSNNPTRLNLLTRWKLVTHLKRSFWDRWSREYLSELQYRHKWGSQQINTKPGDMVIIKQENTAPLNWPLGRVVKVHQGDDGFVRVADVKTATGICRRPIAKLAPLPINTEEASDNSPQHDNKRDHHQHEELNIPKKRRCTSAKLPLLTVMITLILLPLALGGQVHIRPFKTQLGVHFEAIGSVLNSPTAWQLLVYYDLKEFWTELGVFKDETKTLNKICENMHQKTTCMNLVNYFQHTEEALTDDSTLLSGRRHKRAALDLVGNIAHSLFGVLDSEYAKEMEHTISQVKGNEAHLLNLLKNQTSIIDSTINIMKADQEAVKKRFDKLDHYLALFQNTIHNNSIDLQQQKISDIYFSLAIKLTLIASKLQQTQSLILDILTNTHHGIVDPLLLTPHQLQLEVEKIRIHLPETLQLPVKQEDTLQLYRLMKVTGGLTKNTVIFSVTLPLVERESFEIYNLIPIPNWLNKTLVSIKTCSSLLAVNRITNRYFTISKSEFQACSVMNEDVYLCSKRRIWYEQGAQTCNCELNLLHNQTQLDCSVQKIKQDTSWIPLRHSNKWIYAMSVPSPATIVCKRDITQLTLEGSGLLSLDADCTMKHNFTLIQGQQIISNSLKTSYTSLWNITETSQQDYEAPLRPELHPNEYTPNTQNLTHLQTVLAAQEVLQLPNKIETHNYHHMIIGYSSLIITCGIIIYLKFQQRSKASPIPAPRHQQTTSDFTVHI